MNNLRTPDEVQRAHDLLHFACTPEAPAIHDKAGAIACHAAHDALSWVLGFPCGDTFAENLTTLRSEIQRHGFREQQIGDSQ